MTPEASNATKSIGKTSEGREIVGFGALALDLLRLDIGFTSPSAGSTIGNVMAILAALGWRSTPVARIGTDIAGSLLLRDLTRYGVDTSCLESDPQVSTPVWLERLYKTPEGSAHEYSGICPQCGTHLARSVAPTKQMLANAVERLGNADVLFVDRCTDDSLELATAARMRNVLVVFEPSALASRKSLRPLIELSDILKYADDRYTELGTTVLGDGALEIESRGARGLRFRVVPGDWQYRAAEAVADPVDTAGCGDWLTAGMLDVLVRQRRAGTRDALASSILGGHPNPAIDRHLKTGH